MLTKLIFIFGLLASPAFGIALRPGDELPSSSSANDVLPVKPALAADAQKLDQKLDTKLDLSVKADDMQKISQDAEKKRLEAPQQQQSQKLNDDDQKQDDKFDEPSKQQEEQLPQQQQQEIIKTAPKKELQQTKKIQEEKFEQQQVQQQPEEQQQEELEQQQEEIKGAKEPVEQEKGIKVQIHEPLSKGLDAPKPEPNQSKVLQAKLNETKGGPPTVIPAETKQVRKLPQAPRVAAIIVPAPFIQVQPYQHDSLLARKAADLKAKLSSLFPHPKYNFEHDSQAQQTYNQQPYGYPQQQQQPQLQLQLQQQQQSDYYGAKGQQQQTYSSSMDDYSLQRDYYQQQQRNYNQQPLFPRLFSFLKPQYQYSDSQQYESRY